MKLRCSLNGIDASTDFADIERLRSRYPFAEFGISYSEDGHAGQECYAPVDYILRAGETFAGSNTLALHLCYKKAVDDFIHDQGRVSGIARNFSRIQLNFGPYVDHHDYAPSLIRTAFSRHADTTIITAHNPESLGLLEILQDVENHEILFDASAGRGIVGDYPDPLPGIVCGYAGGLCPENLAARLPLIHSAAARQPDAGKRILWVDMESRLRAGARDFPVDRAEACLRIVQDFAHTLDPDQKHLAKKPPVFRYRS